MEKSDEKNEFEKRQKVKKAERSKIAQENLLLLADSLYNQFQQGMAGRQQGVSELNNQFTQGMGLHQQGVQDILSQRQANLGQLSGLMGLGQQMGVPQFENFTGAGQLTTPDMMGAAQSQYGANMDKTNAANADKANTMKTVGTVASIAAAAF